MLGFRLDHQVFQKDAYGRRWFFNVGRPGRWYVNLMTKKQSWILWFPF